MLALFNITGWNGLVLFGLQQLPAGRSAILAYTMPIWSVLFSLAAAARAAVEAQDRRAWRSAWPGHGACCSATTSAISSARRRAALLILGAAVSWAFGTVLLRKWKLPVPQNTLSGWMMLLGWVPLARAGAVLRDRSAARRRPPAAWFAILYNIFLAGTLAHWAWFTLARTLPVAVSSMSSLPVPIVGVFAGMLRAGRAPGVVRVERRWRWSSRRWCRAVAAEANAGAGGAGRLTRPPEGAHVALTGAAA